MKIHKIYLGPPDVLYTALEHNTFCGKVIKNQEILTTEDDKVTCLLCMSNIFKYPERLQRWERRKKEEQELEQRLA